MYKASGTGHRRCTFAYSTALFKLFDDIFFLRSKNYWYTLGVCLIGLCWPTSISCSTRVVKPKSKSCLEEVSWNFIRQFAISEFSSLG